MTSSLTRRSFLRVGALGGLTLAELLRLRAAAAAGPKDTSVILFWMSGGPGHMETWDPKPNAVADFRGPLGVVPTTVPGVHFGELLPASARLMHKLAVLRTVNHGSGDHTKSNHWMLTGFEGPAFNAPDFMVQRRPAMGAAVARWLGGQRSGLPPYVAVPHLRGGTDNFFHYAAYLGNGYNPFVVNSDPNLPSFAVKNLSLGTGMSFERLNERRAMLDHLDDARRVGAAAVEQRDAHYQRAFDLLTSRAVATAFDINAEPDRVRDAYGRHTFGQSALLARRLVEAGCPSSRSIASPGTITGQPTDWRHYPGRNSSFRRSTGPLRP